MSRHDSRGTSVRHRRRSDRRLYPRGFHKKWATLRPDSRLRWKPFVVGMQARLKSQGYIHRRWSAGRSMDDRPFGSWDRHAPVVTLHEPETGHDSGETEPGDLTIMRELMRTGKVTPVIDRRYSLSEVPAAIRYLEEGHARGKVVITWKMTPCKAERDR